MIDQVLGSSPVLNTNAVSPQGQIQGASQAAPRSEQAESVSRFDTEDTVSFSAEALATQDFAPPVKPGNGGKEV